MAEQKKVVTKKTTPKAQPAEGASKGKAAAADSAATAAPRSVPRKTAAKKVAPAPATKGGALQAATTKRSRKAAPPAPAVADHPPVLIPPGEVTPEQRWRMVADAAYFRAEKRNFAPGYEQEDWLAAEAEVDALLRARAQAAKE